MRALSFKRRTNRYLLPVAIFRPGQPTDLTSITATALLDTGATVIGIGPRIIAELGLESYGKNRLRPATDEAFVDYFVFRVGLFSTEQVVEIPSGADALPYIVDEVSGFSWGRHADFDVILGMDILSRCDVNLDRYGTCRIEFG